MFKTEMKEKYQSTVELKDINGISVMCLIEFICTGTIIINNENVLDLLSTADYLQIDKVKQFCFEFLQSVLSSDTCFDILTAANQYQNEQLKTSALECITKDLGDIEFDKDLSKNEFVTCIAKMKENRAKESAIYYAIMSWIKVDVKTRENHLSELLFLLDFYKLTVNFVQTNVLTEELVIENFTCLKLVTKKFCAVANVVQMRQTGTTKVISIGGTKASESVIEVYSTIDKSEMKYPDVPLPNTIIS